MATAPHTRRLPERAGNSTKKGVALRLSQAGARIGALVSILALSALAGAGGAAARPAHATSGITVYAAASLTDVFPAIDSSPSYSFAGSNTLAAQIQNGAPVDVFASANTSLPAQLYAQGLVEKPVVFTRNTLVIVVPKSNPAGITSIYDLTRPGVKVDIANSAVPVGSYTLQVLNQMGLQSQVLANVVSQETDVRTVLSKVQLGQADAGFVYSTDAQTVPGEVSVIKVPAWAQPKVAYSMAVVTKSANQAAAQAFVNEVLSKAGQAEMLKYGFLPITAPVPTIAKVAPLRAKAGARVTITGTNLTGTTSVTFHGVPAKFRVVSATKLTLTVPKQAKTGTITITNPSGAATSKKFTIA
jgi:molybdate transport system substrate-binding protein